ncbi:hypothetical protein [uncultured Maritimibacter sp.]|jgi:hypothetical protein|uniref:hypothetical protein n=2 Tax=Maritimibacter TaxID=404235 RepID=UPI00259157DA|nr:hypothetical protein [uncultured Maritimibacter sp.]
MNMTYVILGLTASYALVVSLLAYLVLLTNIHLVLKIMATVATVATIPLTFWGVGELRGLPSDGNLPGSFRMLWAQMIEPNALQGEDGHVYLWLQALDSDNFPVGPPRAYQLPYSDDLVTKVNEAMGRIAEGEEMQGTIDANEVLPETTSEALAEEIEAEISETRPGGATTAGERISNFDPSMLTFDTEAAPVTPAKPQ